MNRLQLRSEQQESAGCQGEREKAASLPSRALPHAIFAPLHYEPNYAYPLVVWLHGPGDNEYQLRRVMPEISMRNYVAVGPRGTSADGDGFTWCEDGLRATEQAVFESIEVVTARFNIARHRVFLAGYCAGGTMALRLGLLHPGSFAGALSISGPFPLGTSALVRLGAARHLPLFIAQGRQSRVYTAHRTCEELRLFHAAGLSVHLRQYPCEDELTTQMLRDADAWLMEQITGIPAVQDCSDFSDGVLN
jgi:phospholipase/carboxylesterase